MSDAAFESWWEAHGQYGRAGGGEYEKTFAYNAWRAAVAMEREKWESLCRAQGFLYMIEKRAKMK